MSDSDQQAVLTLTIQDKSVLFGAYMPFLQNGGLFVPTTTPYRLEDELLLFLTLMDEPGKPPEATASCCKGLVVVAAGASPSQLIFPNQPSGKLSPQIGHPASFRCKSTTQPISVPLGAAGDPWGSLGPLK